MAIGNMIPKMEEFGRAITSAGITAEMLAGAIKTQRKAREEFEREYWAKAINAEIDNNPNRKELPRYEMCSGGGLIPKVGFFNADNDSPLSEPYREPPKEVELCLCSEEIWD